MTEAEWLANSDLRMMIYEFMAGGLSERKLRLFGVACCHQIWEEIPEGVCRAGVCLSEAAADLRTEDDSLAAVHSAIWSEHRRLVNPQLPNIDGNQAHSQSPNATAVITAYYATSASMNWDVAGTVARDAAYAVPSRPQALVQADLFRDIVGNPFRPVTFDPFWRTSTVLALAQGIYDSRDFSPMPILADALEDAGCDNTATLTHCRGPGPHVRGCWVVDLILGKA